MITVSMFGDGDFKTIGDAILSIPDVHEETITIFVKPGVYNEKLFIRKSNLKIIGQDPLTTVIRYNDGAKKLREDGSEYRTSNTFTVLFAGRDITVENITIENYAGYGEKVGQAVAAYIASDCTAFYNCRFIAFQDTIFVGEINEAQLEKLMLPDYFKNTNTPIMFPLVRNYFEDCYIRGDVDFIFGSNTCYFNRCTIDSCELRSEETAYITAANTPISQEFGLVFYDCNLIGDAKENSVYLGRPWRSYAKTAFLHCNMEGHIKEEGWHNWDKPNAEVTCSYVEYANTGVGSKTNKRANFSKQLTNPGLEEYYHPLNVLRGEDLWNPVRTIENNF